ncbi:MAG: LytTR family DNA-binding domain-containing protein [Pseudomonadota bacterium]
MTSKISAFWAKWRRRVSYPGNIAIWALASLGAAWAGPFGSYYGLNFPGALAFWGTIIGTSLVLASVIMTVREVAFADRNPILAELVSCITFTAVFGPLVWMFIEVVHAAHGGALLSLFQCILATLILSVGIVILRLILVPAPTVPVLQPIPQPTGPRLMRRLPDGDAGPILRLSGRDHFVEIVTPASKHQVRMRLSDAVDEMDGVEGLYTHRSHWVAREAIKELKRSGSRHYVVSADAELIPVSRSNLPKLTDAGLVF